MISKSKPSGSKDLLASVWLIPTSDGTEILPIFSNLKPPKTRPIRRRSAITRFRLTLLETFRFFVPIESSGLLTLIGLVEIN
jgi:hypothetical protein